MDLPPTLPPPADGLQLERLRELTEAFLSTYGHKPEFYIRSPGRVNLIGEHVDYCGYAVFPMAVQQDFMVAVSINDSRELNLSNIDSQYPSMSRQINDITIEKTKGKPAWYSYFLCGMKGVLEAKHLTSSVGLDVVISGAVPPCAGLSSSSALVCAGALTTAKANKLNISKLEMASLCARAERYIGTEGGGMDQAICFLAQPGTAKLIEFNPLKATDVRLPSGAVFVIANSLAELNKAATSDFNCRVMECRLATQLLAHSKAIDRAQFRRLGDLQKHLGASFDEMLALVKDTLHFQPYTKNEVCKTLGVSEKELDETTLSENTRHIQSFHLYRRAKHVFSEASRVWQFKNVCEDGGPDSLAILGRLMFESHASCRDNYECSHPKLDELVKLSTGIAYGARLTGAGWGGCIVALVPGDKVEEYMSFLRAEYYNKLTLPEGQMISAALFPSPPAGGACVFAN